MKTSIATACVILVGIRDKSLIFFSADVCLSYQGERDAKERLFLSSKRSLETTAMNSLRATVSFGLNFFNGVAPSLFTHMIPNWQTFARMSLVVELSFLVSENVHHKLVSASRLSTSCAKIIDRFANTFLVRILLLVVGVVAAP